MHWKNSNFQIQQFIAGSCHTPDEAYRKLCELREERDVNLKAVIAADKRAQAKILKAQRILDNEKSDEVDILEAEADLAEIEAFKEQNQACIDEAFREHEFIKELIEKIKPFRKFSHLPDYEAHQMAQQEEWKLELLFRAENYLATQGFIPPDQLGIMRMHPEWETLLLPKIQQIGLEIQNKNINILTNKSVPLLENNS